MVKTPSFSVSFVPSIPLHIAFRRPLFHVFAELRLPLRRQPILDGKTTLHPSLMRQDGHRAKEVVIVALISVLACGNREERDGTTCCSLVNGIIWNKNPAHPSNILSFTET